MEDAHLPRRTRRRADALALDAIARGVEDVSSLPWCLDHDEAETWSAARAEETRECMESDASVVLECELPHWALVPHGAPSALGLMAIQSGQRLG
jgi:hypothetical protein